jgi:hypothetical protein
VVQSPKAQKPKDNLQGHIMAYRCTVACYVFAIKSMALDIASITMEIGTDRGNAHRAEKLGKSDLNSNIPGPLLRTFGHLGVAQGGKVDMQRHSGQSFSAMVSTFYLRRWSDPKQRVVCTAVDLRGQPLGQTAAEITQKRMELCHVVWYLRLGSSAKIRCHGPGSVDLDCTRSTRRHRLEVPGGSRPPSNRRV